jgi:xanthine/CO dehydrogenase XdhC/CoxF family maturation factor
VETLRKSGLAMTMSSALSPWRKPRAVHDPGKVQLDVALAVALGEDCLADVALLRAEPDLFGPVASDPAVFLVTPVPADAPDRKAFQSALSAAARGEAAARVRVVRGPAELLGRALAARHGGSCEGGLGGRLDLDRAVADETRFLLNAGRTGTFDIAPGGARWGSPRTESGKGTHREPDLTLFVESSVPPPRMLVFGAIDFAAALVRMGKTSA